MAFKPIDGKRDEFRKYLERTGVLEAISKVFVKLVNCQERPENAIEFIRENLGDTLQQSDTIERLKRELEDARNEISQLKRTIETLKAEKAKSATATESFGKNASSSTEESVNNATVNIANNPIEGQEDSPPAGDQKDAATVSVSEPNEPGNETQNSSTKEIPNKAAESN